MIDGLVWELNQLGYQPAWLPQTGLVPPDVYNVAKVAGVRRLVRRGPLRNYLPAVTNLTVRRGRTVDIDHHETTKKKHASAVAFLRRALGCLGVSSISKLDLGFADGADLTISFADVQFVRVDIAAIEPLLPQLQTHAIPDELITSGRLHLAYEYLYAGSLRLARADQRAFDGDVAGRLDELVDVAGGAQVRVESGTRLVFAGKGVRAAFAYKAARLSRSGGASGAPTRWEIDLSSAPRSVGAPPSNTPYLPTEPGVVLESSNDDDADT